MIETFSGERFLSRFSQTLKVLEHKSSLKWHRLTLNGSCYFKLAFSNFLVLYKLTNYDLLKYFLLRSKQNYKSFFCKKKGYILRQWVVMSVLFLFYDIAKSETFVFFFWWKWLILDFFLSSRFNNYNFARAPSSPSHVSGRRYFGSNQICPNM